MTSNEKNKIIELKKLGYGYKKIAKELDLSLSIVRYACSKKNDDDLLDGSCENCGIKIKSIKGKKKKRFCSDKCRWKWWNKNQNKVDKKAFYAHVCKWCNKEFTVYGNNHRVYCSHDCYIKSKTSKGAMNHGTK